MEPLPSVTGLMLGEHPIGALLAAPWAGALIGLGARLARYAERPTAGQLVVAITVPVRDLAAVLIASGWSLTRPIADPGNPADVAATLTRGTPVRMVTDQLVVADRFYEIELHAKGGPRVRVGASSWQLEKIRYLFPFPDMPERRFRRLEVISPGSLTQKTGQSSTWLAKLCVPNTDLAILGTKSWLDDEMTLCVGWGSTGFADEIGSILLADMDNAPTWSTRIYAAQRLPEELDLPDELVAVILDSGSAISRLPEVESTVVVAIIDRRSPDETPPEMVMQCRARSEPISLDALRWAPPPGVEALAFKESAP